LAFTIAKKSVLKCFRASQSAQDLLLMISDPVLLRKYDFDFSGLAL
jgi:flagellar assembly factor FliW